MPAESESGPRFVFRDSPGTVFRVGYGPDPWAWTDWSLANGGRFTGRWDSEDGSYRTLYAGDSLYGCLVEILARFRPDPAVVAAMAAIEVSDSHDELYPTVDAGTVDASWFSNRRVGRADLAGRYCDVANSRTIAALRDSFAAMAIQEFGLSDFDSSALQNSQPRALTQRVGRFILGRDASDGGPFDGIQFGSHHGADIVLWAIFEQADDGITSARLDNIDIDVLHLQSPDLLSVLRLHNLTIA
ncbi:RES domain-containing protein [Plantibacter cousiniae (nom. nud.)]|uniref:RES domain-containing protein n=1 Tax=Plantibacter cousiniae (nom. nud.) TaxID=199709 RepID=UPI001E644169|nr:RES domain-containing protein [Plantibacter cousiniae]